MKHSFRFLVPLALSLASVSAMAKPASHVLVAPACVTASIPHTTLATSNNLKLTEVSDTNFKKILSEKDSKKKNCGGFFDVTASYQKQGKMSLTNKTNFLNRFSEKIPEQAETYAIHHNQQVEKLMNGLNPQSMWSNLLALSNFSNRYANSYTGAQTATFIKDQLEEMIKESGRDDITISTIETKSYKQPSIVMKLGNSNAPGVVLGAHMDTLYAYFSNMPGADDDGTGTVTVLELARSLIASGAQFKRPIYFVWYAAEEVGLVGSQHVVEDFIKQGISVRDVIQFDMTGYESKNDTAMWLINDYTSRELTNFLSLLIKTYVKKPVMYTRCGYACSDHATWTINGFKAAIATEAQFEKMNPYIHSSNDKMEYLSLDHMTDYLKLGLAFAVELADPIA